MLNELVHVIKKSSNAKTGPIPVTMTSESSCPSACPLKGAGCYAEGGNMRTHWKKLSNSTEETGSYLTWNRFCSWVESLAPRVGWRHNTAGDLPHTGDGKTIDRDKLAKLVKANAVGSKRGFTYTHHDMNVAGNAEAVKAANDGGFTVNLSADGLREADELAELGIATVVTIMPKTADGRAVTPAGRKVIECPASRGKVDNCMQCGFLCAKANRKSIIGFVPHGVSKAKVTKIMEVS